jgi:hypothetical protein
VGRLVWDTTFKGQKEHILSLLVEVSSEGDKFVRSEIVGYVVSRGEELSW